MRPIHVSAIAGLSVLSFGAAQAEIEGTIHSGINTEYIWRGIDQSFGVGSDSMWESGVDLSLGSIAGWDIGAGVWYASVHGASTFDEIDYYASASRSFGCVDVEKYRSMRGRPCKGLRQRAFRRRLPDQHGRHGPAMAGCA